MECLHEKEFELVAEGDCAMSVRLEIYSDIVLARRLVQMLHARRHHFHLHFLSSMVKIRKIHLRLFLIYLMTR